jgi:hypothetical protein
MAIRDSLWLFPVIEAFHLVAFGVLGGTILLVDLRLLGIVMKSQPVGSLAEDARPWQRGSLAVAILTGSLLFLSEPIKLYYNEPFWTKMTCLGLALVFSFTVRRKVTADMESAGPFWARLTGLISLVLWGGVAWGGRWIGFWG